MAYASKAGRARVSAKNPQAQGVCDRCGIWNNLVNLEWQHQWAGTRLQNLWIRVCSRCLDVPQEQLRAIQLPADPVPVWQPRVENFVAAETNYRTVGEGTIDPITGLPIPSSDYRVTEDCENRVTQEIGAPTGLIQSGIMPFNGGIQKQFGVRLSPLSVTSNGTATVSCTFSAPHGLKTDDQIAVEGLSNPKACGFFSVSVSNPMAFTYITYSDIPSSPLLTGTTRMITCLIGLPYGDPQIPQVGP
jgi:hypothetical protein